MTATYDFPVMYTVMYDHNRSAIIRDWGKEKNDPNLIERTEKLGNDLREAGVEVRFVYSPNFIFLNEGEQAVAYTCKSRVVNEKEDVISIIKKHAGNDWVFLYVCTKFDCAPGDLKIRYALVNPKRI